MAASRQVAEKGLADVKRHSRKNTTVKTIMSFKEDIKRPFNVLTLSLTIFSILLAFVLYFYSQYEKRIAYTFSVPYKIYDSRASSPKIRITDQNGYLTNEDVYLVRATVWNDGEVPIEPSEVRKPLTVILSPSNKILDIKIINQVHPDIAQYKIAESSDIQTNPDSQRISINWDHFDPKFGISFQVIYTGSEITKPHLEGNIVGVNEFHDAEDELYISRFLPFKIHGVVAAGIIGGLLPLLLLRSISFISREVKKGLGDKGSQITNDQSRTSLLYPSLYIAIMIFVLLFIYFILLSKTEPPF